MVWFEGRLLSGMWYMQYFLHDFPAVIKNCYFYSAFCDFLGLCGMLSSTLLVI